MEQKVILKYFIEQIEVDNSGMKVIYNIPIAPDNPPTETVGAFPIVNEGPLLVMLLPLFRFRFSTI